MIAAARFPSAPPGLSALPASALLPGSAYGRLLRGQQRAVARPGPSLRFARSGRQEGWRPVSAVSATPLVVRTGRSEPSARFGRVCRLVSERATRGSVFLPFDNGYRPLSDAIGCGSENDRALRIPHFARDDRKGPNARGRLRRPEAKRPVATPGPSLRSGRQRGTPQAMQTSPKAPSSQGLAYIASSFGGLALLAGGAVERLGEGSHLVGRDVRHGMEGKAAVPPFGEREARVLDDLGRGVRPGVGPQRQSEPVLVVAIDQHRDLA